MKVGSTASLAACVVKLSLSDVLKVEAKEKAFIFRRVMYHQIFILGQLPSEIKLNGQIKEVLELC